MKSQEKECLVCGEGCLHEKVEKNPVEYKTEKAILNLHMSVCDICDSEQADAEQTKANKRLMIAFRKTVDNLLSGQEIKTIREKLGLTQSQASTLFGGGPVAFSKYENDDLTQSEPMDKLLRSAALVPGVLGFLQTRAGTIPDYVGVPSSPYLFQGCFPVTGELSVGYGLTSLLASAEKKQVGNFWVVPFTGLEPVRANDQISFSSNPEPLRCYAS